MIFKALRHVKRDERIAVAVRVWPFCQTHSSKLWPDYPEQAFEEQTVLRDLR